MKPSVPCIFLARKPGATSASWSCPKWLRDIFSCGRSTSSWPLPIERSTAFRSLLSSFNTNLQAGHPRGFKLLARKRSGERRGGEEGRSRGAPDHLKKKKK